LEPWDFYDIPNNGNVIIPTDEVIFFGGVGQPPTRCSGILVVEEGYGF
jgi:hypothetical protein